MAELENGGVQENSGGIEGNLFHCKLKSGEPDVHGGRQSRPLFEEYGSLPKIIRVAVRYLIYDFE